MNDSMLRKMAEQAFQSINDISTEGVADRYTFKQAWFQMYNQKFAELILKECIRIDKENPDAAPGVEIASHFGVEE